MQSVFATCLLFIFLLPGTGRGQALEVYDLRRDHRVEPLGTDLSSPRLSWKIKGEGYHILQTAYQVRVALSERDLERDRRLVWDSGKVMSDRSANVPYQGPAPEAKTRYFWQVRVWDNQGRSSEWSPVSWWETGLAPGTWQAQWISPPADLEEGEERPSPYFRRAFELGNRIERARLYITSRGLYEAYLNGERVGDQLFTPGWTSYNERLQYQTYDVTRQVRSGDNVLGVTLADGWYRGTIGWVDQRDRYGSQLALLTQLEITYADGRTQRLSSDPEWRVATGPILEAEIYHGEVYDARKGLDGWAQPGYDANDWKEVVLADHPFDNLVAPDGVPVRKVDTLNVVEIFTAPNGDTLVDFGQNLVGHVRFRVSGPAGHTLTIRHAEVLDKEGNIYLENLRSAKARLKYTLRGEGEEFYEPRFTFMGFRYLRLENWPGTPEPSDLQAIVVHSDMDPAGSFSCSDPLLDQLQHNIQWGQKGNFLDVPTDCPQRDERMGWTGDAQAFASTAAFNFDVAAFFLKWLQDLEADQREDGAVPHVIPHVLGDNAYASAGWADAATIIPWNLYQAYGDPTFLRQQYESMKAWVDFMAGAAGEDMLWNEGFHFGDWLFYSENDDRSGRSAVTDKYLIAQAFFAHSADLLARSAQVLGKEADARRYADLHEEVVEAFLREYVTPSGRMVSGTQTAFVLALAFDLLPPEQRAGAAQRLAENIRRYGHLTTGFLGTPYLCHVLSDHGYTELAYELLERTDYPSWLYPVTMGATTIWERWDGIKPDSTFQNVGMNSFNHYAYGAIGDWMYRVVAGLNTDPEQPGYRHALVRPRPGGSLTYARARHETPYGSLACGWEKANQQLTLSIEVPPNSTATAWLPGAREAEVRRDGRSLATGEGVLDAAQDGQDVRLALGSGRYTFSYPLASDQ